MDRRGFLAASIGTASAVALGGTVAPSISLLKPPLVLGPLLNRARASRIMRQARLDALLVTTPLNVYYTTNAIPVLSRFSTQNTALALLPADTTRPIAYITDGFEYYAGAADSGLAQGVVPYLMGGGFASQDPRSSPAFGSAGTFAFDAREQRRRELLNRAAPFHESLSKATQKALTDLGLSRAKLGIDTPSVTALLEDAAPRVTTRMADDLMLHIRLVKTPAEQLLMRRAAANNVDAAIATALQAREVGSIWALRQRFYQEAAARGNVGVYGSIDLVMSELADGTFREGQAFMIDFVSHCGYYQGDYGRTVCYGEPDPQMQRAAQVGISAWQEIRDRLQPGLRFSQIHGIGVDTVQRLGEKYTYAFHPHSVGLQHWDQPLKTVDGGPLDLQLEPGMVLSVDCPLLNAGVNGTTHMEDLVLITENGCEVMHRESDGWIQV